MRFFSSSLLSNFSIASSLITCFKSFSLISDVVRLAGFLTFGKLNST